MGKVLYIAKRHPAFTPDGFTARWRKHGALAMSLPLWRRMHAYVQASVIDPAGIAGASRDYDAIGVLWTVDTPMAGTDLDDVATLARDELETFSGYVGPGTQPLDETVLKHDGPGRTTAYLFFSDAQAARRVAETAAASAEADRVALNLPTPGANRAMPYEAIVEIAARDTGGLKSALGPSGAAPAGVELALVAREAILWG
jgi:hypothetical protein